MTTMEHSLLEQRTLGTQGLRVSEIGLGCMGMSDFYGADASTERESIATIQRALDMGINLFDTGDFYGMGHNEMLIGRAIQGRRDQAILSVKFGALRDPNGAFLGFDGRPTFVKTSLAYSLRRLGVDYRGPLLSFASRPQRSHRRYNRRGRRNDSGRQSAVRGAVGGLGGHSPARPCGAPDQRITDRILAVVAGPGG
jgi:hypothetical protein